MVGFVVMTRAGLPREVKGKPVAGSTGLMSAAVVVVVVVAAAAVSPTTGFRGTALTGSLGIDHSTRSFVTRTASGRSAGDGW